MERSDLLLFVFPGLFYVLVSLQHTLPTFHGYTPPVSCQNENLTSTDLQQGNFSLPELEYFTISVVTEWRLWCERRYEQSLVGSVYYAGVTLGAVSWGVLADRWGRRPVFLACILLQAALGVALFFAPSLAVYLALRCLQGFFVEGMNFSLFTLVVEHIKGDNRILVALFLQFYWILGIPLLAGLDALCRDWRILSLVLGSPALLVLPFMRYVPESRRWLAVRKGQVTRNTVTQSTAKEEAAKSILETARPERKQRCWLLDLMLTPTIRLYTAVSVSQWFVVVVTTFVVLLSLPALGGDRHLNLLYGALLDMPLMAAAYWAVARLGRRRPLAVSLAVSALLCIPAAFSPGMVRVALMLAAKSFNNVAFYSGALFSAELFPTSLRAAALGLCGFWGRAGSLVAPQLLFLGETVGEMVPLLLVAGLGLVQAALTLLLPDTQGRGLPDTVRDAQMLALKTS